MSEESSGFHEKAFQRVDDRDDATYFETCDKDFSMDQGGTPGRRRFISRNPLT